MSDIHDNCKACGARFFAEGASTAGRAISYDCLAEVFVERGGKVRVIKPCLYTKATRMAP